MPVFILSVFVERVIFPTQSITVIRYGMRGISPCNLQAINIDHDSGECIYILIAL